MTKTKQTPKKASTPGDIGIRIQSPEKIMTHRDVLRELNKIRERNKIKPRIQKSLVTIVEFTLIQGVTMKDITKGLEEGFRLSRGKDQN